MSITDRGECPRTPRSISCLRCGAEPTEDCPLVGLTILEGQPITAGTASVCEDDGVCEACQ